MARKVSAGDPLRRQKRPVSAALCLHPAPPGRPLLSSRSWPRRAAVLCLPASRNSPHPPLQLIGLKAKLYAKKRHSEKILMKKTISQHSERNNKHKADDSVPQGAVPHYLLDREQASASGLPPRGLSGC